MVPASSDQGKTAHTMTYDGGMAGRAGKSLTPARPSLSMGVRRRRCAVSWAYTAILAYMPPSPCTGGRSLTWHNPQAHGRIIPQGRCNEPATHGG